MINKFIKMLSIYKRKYKYKKISYSFNGVDIIIDYISSLEYKTQFLIYDMSGKIMKHGEFKHSGKKKINLNNIPSGNYYLNYCIDNRTITHKFVIK